MHERTTTTRIHAFALSLMVLLWAGSAWSYELRLIPTTPLNTSPSGADVSFELYIDTRGQSDISTFSVAIGFDDRVLAYRPDLSDAEDYYPLYAPGVGKAPATWLVPSSNPPALFIGSPTPQFGGQVNVGFEVNTGPGSGTTGTATNLYLATITFEPVSPGASPILFGFGQGGTSFILGDGSDIQGQVGAFGSTDIFVGPEPGTALLLATGLLVLGHARRRRL
jgi:hypothetical protein